MASRKRLPPHAARHGLSAEILDDRVCADAIDAAYAVHEALGVSHTAETYLNALSVELGHRGLRHHRQATFSVLYRARVVGTFVADLLIEDRVLINVVADAELDDGHKTDTVRGLAAGGVSVGLVFQFGLPELFFARIL